MMLNGAETLNTMSEWQNFEIKAWIFRRIRLCEIQEQIEVQNLFLKF